MEKTSTVGARFVQITHKEGQKTMDQKRGNYFKKKKKNKIILFLTDRFDRN